ncbi:hypothetical protein [Candidatus Similichlamydia epinepheli]|uniref:hypothetical protein n=1 Tax=Candidatus Similichlamydia epinepheli TaxID=1903953 RepID=UPI000D377DE9|nr:hypothetical protein [Candidatus Similichlamydia epinepheli]
MNLSQERTTFLTTIFTLICPAILMAGAPQPYELDNGFRKLPEGKLSKNISVVEFDPERAQLCGDALILTNTRVVDMGIKKFIALGDRPIKRTLLVYETSCSTNIHPKVSAYGALRILVEGGYYNIDIGGSCYTMGLFASLFEGQNGKKINGFVEGTWGFNNRCHALEAMRLISTGCLTLGKEWDSFTFDVSFGASYRSERDARDTTLLYSVQTLIPGCVLFCSPEVTYQMKPSYGIGMNAGAYWKGSDMINSREVAPQKTVIRGEVFYTWTPTKNCSVRLFCATTTQTRGLGSIGFKCTAHN